METFLNIAIVFGVILVLWLAVLTFLLVQTLSHYRKLTTKVEGKNLKSILEELLEKIKADEKTIAKLTDKVEKLERDGGYHFQKVGLVRFNPFEETGGDQSFTLALLDGRENGVVISSLYRRDETRVYAKPVKRGKETDYEFSEEEKAAIKRAVKS